MGMSLETISKWLDEDDTKHHHDQEKEVIIFGAKGDVQTIHFIRLREEGELFDYQVQIRVDDENLVVPSDHTNINKLLQYLLHKNYVTKFGCWEYDYTDGDIRFSVEIPLEDGSLTQKQFNRITSMMYTNVDTMCKEILDLLEDESSDLSGSGDSTSTKSTPSIDFEDGI